MKLYTEEQVRKMIEDMGSFSNGGIDYRINQMTPIELPSNEEIDAIANDIGHNYFVMQRSHYEGLIEGSKRMAYLLMKRFKEEDNGTPFDKKG